ncbi:MAG: hypothetical protein P3B76_07520 [Gemmatimonadota bacterium]|nr:hypothetical protein [Gemmatimonadota bacterium]MDQ8166536.1 hypothetical protein [Gemmatimonadota bacterium]MDQ8172517.1 hypothetical protein [Gemmatimonadota bacterium]
MTTPPLRRLARAVISLTLTTGILIAARPRFHEVWIGIAVGADGAAMRGDLEMFAGNAPNTTVVELAQRNDVPGARRAWHVRRGTCATPGQLFGDSTAYPAIRIGKGGKGVGTVTLPLAIPDTGDFHVAVTASPRDRRRVACGDLVLED